MLTFVDGRPFATSASGYEYRPATEQEDASRLVLQITIAGVQVAAVVDTGAPYVVCTPYVAQSISLNIAASLGRKTLLIRGSWVTGYLYRLPLKFVAEQGDDVQVDATVFAPDPDWEEWWGELPSFIGMGGCLERIRFAVEPSQDLFYFGPL